MRRAIAVMVWLAATLWAVFSGAPAFADAAPAMSLAAWVSANTDLPAAQVAIAGPDNVYSVEPIGPRLPTGEVLALVRTEALSPDWGATHRFQSWDAHMLFDCQGGRIRVLRSASYAEHNRGGAAKADERGDAWLSPDKASPAEKLLAAACDPAFSWPLRGASAAPPSTGAAAPAPAPTIQKTTGAEGGLAAPLAKPGHVQVAQAALAAKTPQAVPATVIAMRVASTVTPQHAVTIAAVTGMGPALQKANFIPLPAAPQAAVAPQVIEDRPRVVAAAATASRTCRRVAGAVRTWLWRRVEVAWTRRGEQAPGAVSPSTAAVTT